VCDGGGGGKKKIHRSSLEKRLDGWSVKSNFSDRAESPRPGKQRRKRRCSHGALKILKEEEGVEGQKGA